jgi:hypothetical protein
MHAGEIDRSLGMPGKDEFLAQANTATCLKVA